MANPAIRNSPLIGPLHRAPVSTTRDSPSRSAATCGCIKGTTHDHRRHRLHVPRLQRRPLRHDAGREDGPRPDRPDDHAAGRLEARRRRCATSSTSTRRQAEAEDAEIPGVPGGKMRSSPSRPTTAPSWCGCAGVSKNPADEFQRGDRRVALGRRDPQAADRPRLGRLLRADGRGPARVREALEGGPALGPRGSAPKAAETPVAPTGPAAAGPHAVAAAVALAQSPTSSSRPSCAAVTAQPGGFAAASLASASSSAASPISIGPCPKCENTALRIP